MTAWTDIAGAFNSGVLGAAVATTNLAGSAFDVSIPLVRSSFAQAVDLPGKLQAPFGVTLDPNATDLQKVANDLRALGFTVERLDVNPDPTTHDLVRLSKDFTFGGSQASLIVGGAGGGSAPGKCDGLGFCYFDDHVAGGLNISTLTATVPPITFHVTFGVDLAGTTPQLFLQDATPDAGGKFTGLDPFTVSGQTHLTGRMNIKNLLNVQIDGDAILSLTAGLSFKSPDPSHKLRLPDLISANVIGNLSGSARFANVNLSTQLPVLPALSWTGNFSATIASDAQGHKTVTRNESTVAPDAWGTLKNLVGGLFNITPSLDFLKPIASALKFKIPLFNFTLGEKLGLGDLSTIINVGAPSIGSGGSDAALQSVESVLNNLFGTGKGIYIGIPPNIADPQHKDSQPKTLADLGALLYHVIQGDKVDLLSFHQSGGSQWRQSFCFTFFDLGVPGVADVHLDACFGGYVGWDYSVGFGLDTTGFYIDPSTHIGVNGGIYAGLHGGLRVLGFDLASADGRIGLDASARLSVRNPDPSQGDRIYLDEIFTGGNVFQSILNALQVDFTIDMIAHVEAKLDLFFATITLFSHDWDLGRLVDVHLAAATTQSKRAVRLNLQDKDLSQDPAVNFSNGVLTLDGRGGTPANPNLVLLSGKDGTVDANWQGHGIGHFTGVNQVKFLGGTGNDRVQVKPGFNIPIYAQGGPGSNYFEAGDGNSTLLGGGSSGKPGATLIGGAGHDWLQGSAGNDLLLGGSGDSTLIGGGGSDLLRAGTGNDLLLGGTPADFNHPERGVDPNDPDLASDTLDGVLRNSTLWAGNGPDTLIAGYGTDQLHGGKGDDLLIAGAVVDSTANPPVVTGGGNDTVWAGSGNNTIRGGQGNDTLYGAPQGTFTVGSDGHLAFTTSVTSHNTIQGGSGNNVIYGSPNNDLLIAGSGNDRLYSDSDVSHKTTLVAGPGEDWLYAGQGDDLLRLPFGVNTGGVRSHFVGGPGHDILAVTTDAADHYIRLTQSSATNFTATSYADPGETQQQGSFNFEVLSDLHGNFIQTLALEAVTGNNKLDVAPEVRKNVLLKGGNGNDTLIGGGINTLMGGTGNDLLQGGPGTDPGTYNEFHGGTGSTTMIGGAGNDVFYGGTGDNTMIAGNGRVVMYGGKSPPGQRNHDTMSVGSLNLMVVMIAGANDVTMYGGPGKNVLLGGTGSAEMHAGDGDSVLTGGSGPVTLYGGAGYDVLIGGTGTNVLHADDPTRVPPNHSTEDWQTRFDELHDQIAATRAEEDRLTALINNPNTPRDQIPALQAQKALVIQEDGQIAQAIYQLDVHYAPHNQDSNPMTRYYDNPNVLMGGDGPTAIYGSTFPNYILAGNGRTTIYSGGADDTVTGTAGKDTFFVPPLPDNATAVFTAQDDGYGNKIPVITVDAGAVHQVEKVHSRGITQIGVVAGAGNNTIQVNLGSYALYDIAVQCTSGNDRIDLTGFQGGATVQAGSGNDVVVGGSPTRGVELDGGSGPSTYEVDGNGVLVQAEGSPSMLSVYVGYPPYRTLQTRITKTTFRRLSIQGQAGTNEISVGPLGNFSFPGIIASAGPGNKALSAYSLTQSQPVTLVGGAGNDTLQGGSGPNYFLGGTGDTVVDNYKSGDILKSGGGTINYGFSDNFYSDPTGVPPAGWSSRLVNSPGQTYSVQVRPNGGLYGQDNYMFAQHNMNVKGAIQLLNLFRVHDPSSQGRIQSLNLFFVFKTLSCSWAPTCNMSVAFAIQQGGAVFILPVASPWNYQAWQYYQLNSVGYSQFSDLEDPNHHPDFSSSGAPLQFGLLTSNGNLGDTPISATWGMTDFSVGINSTPVPPSAASFRITSSTASPTAGVSFNFTVTALDVAGNPLPGYRGTVHFAGNDPTGLLPADYSFTAADNGVHTFFAILKTAGPRSLTVTQTDAGFISGLAAVAVLPAATDHFQVATSIGTSTAGSAFTVTVRALDAYGNVATGYRGTVHFTGTSGQAALPADYTFTAADNGSKSFTVTLATAGWQAITVVDTANRALAGTVPTVTRYPVLSQTVSAEQLIVAGPDGNIWFTEYGPNKIGRMRPDGGVTEFTIPTPNSNPTGITVGPDGNIWFLERYGNKVGRITLDGRITEFAVGVGDLFDITTGPDGNLWFTSAGGQRIGRIHPDGTGLTWFTLAGDAEPYRITVGPDGNLWFTSHTQNVLRRITPAGQISDFPLPAGVSRCVGITSGPGASLWLACDSANEILQFNVSAGFTQYRLPPGTNPRDITTSDGNLWFTGADLVGGMTPAGVVTTFSMGMPDGGVEGIARAADRSVWFTLAAVSQVGRLAPGLAIVPAAGGYSVTATPNPVAAGATLSVTVTARDPYGNVATGYRGTVHAPISDGQPSSDYTFTAADNGSHTFTITLIQAGSRRIVSVSDTQGLTGNATVNVTPLAAVSLSLTSTQGSVVAGALYQITVSARDQYNNIAAGYRGTVYFGGTDGQGTLPATYTFTAADQGAKTFAVVLRTAGPQTLRATDTANAMLRASLDTVVSPAAAVYFNLVSLTNPVTAGTAFTLTVTAYDAFNNVATDYTGTVSFSSNDGGATLPGNATFTAADSGSKSFTATLRTAGWRSFMVVDTANSGLRGSGPVVTPGGHPHGIILGPDGNLWFNERVGNTIDRLTPAGINTTFAIPTPNSLPDIIVTGPDGNLWFTEHATGKIGRVNLNHTPIDITEFPALGPNDDLVGLVVGPDHNLWFTGRASNLLGRITMGGDVKIFQGLFSTGLQPNKLVLGPDGNLWASSFSGGRVAQINIAASSPSVMEFPVPPGSQEVIAAGPDNAIWVTLPQANEIVKVGTDGHVASTFTVPTPDSFPFGITGGSDGNVWFTEAQGNKVVRMTPSGVITEFPLATFGGQPWVITTGPDGNLWFTELAGDKIGRVGPGMLVVPAAATRLGVSASPTAVTAGAPLTMTVTAYDTFGNVATGYTGTVHFTSSDGQAVLPGDYTFTAADQGVHPFMNVALKAAGSETLIATDTANASITGRQAGIMVTPAAAVSLLVAIAPSAYIAGVPAAVTVTAYDAYGNVATGYRGTINFASSDPQAIQPGNYTFTATDNGNKVFGLTLKTAGTQTLTVMDTANNAIRGTGLAVTAFPVLSQTTGGEQLIVAGPDGNLWFTEYGANKIGRMRPDGGITEFGIGTPDSHPTGITVGPDHNIWFLERDGGGKVGRITPDGSITEFPVNFRDLFDITTGPDGNLWFTSAGGQRIGRMNTSGTLLTWFPLAGDAEPYRITVGPDGNLWFTSHTQNVLRRITPDGRISDFPLPVGVSRCVGITSGPGASLWLACDRANEILQFNVAAGFTEYRLPAGMAPRDITTGADGNLWFTGSDLVSRMTPAGAIMTFPMATPGSGVEGLARAPDGSLWFTLASISQVGRLGAGVVVSPAAAATLTVTGFPSPITAGTVGVVTVTAKDAFGNVATGYRGTVHFSSSDPQATAGNGLPADYTFSAADNGVHTFMVTLKTAATQSLTATDTQTASITGTQAGIVVNPAAAASFRLAPAANPVDADVVFNVTITALDAYGNLATGYTGTVSFSSSDVQAMLPGNTTFTAADHGTHTVSVTLKTAGMQSLTATDTTSAGITGTASVTVRPGAAQSLQLTGLPATIAAGAHFNITVTALDQFGNVASGYTGTITFASSDPQATLPPDYTFTTGTGADNGTHTFTDLIDRLAGNRSLTVSDNGNGLLVTGMFQVTPATASQFQVAGFPSPATAGVSGTFTVTALDPFGNVDVNYRGTVTFSSSDPGSQVMLPADYTFSASDNGVHTFTATLVTAGPQSLTAADSQFPLSINGTQEGITVVAAAADHFLIATSVDGSSTVAGSPFDVTVTVQDLYGNTVTGYLDTVTFSSQDPYSATLPPDYTFQPGDMGQVTFSGVTTLYTAGVWDITATDTADNTITGSDNVPVTPASATHFLIGAPATVAPGMAFDVTVTAMDRYGNIDVNYQGTVTFTTTDGDPGVMIPLDYTFTAADAGVHTFTGGFTLMTLGDQTITATDTSNSLLTGMATVTVASTGAPGSDAPGAAGNQAEALDATSTAPVESDQQTKDHRSAPSPRSGDNDLGSRPLGLELWSAVSPRHTRNALWEAMDQFFSEDLFN